MNAVFPLTCRTVTLKDVYAFQPIPSAFTTDRVFRLDHERCQDTTCWRLSEQSLPAPLNKTHDRGNPVEWLSSYEDSGPPESFFFMAVEIQGECIGLLTWKPVPWNSSTSLLDIRVREDTRRIGAGTKLVNELKQIARGRGLRGINVETQVNNYPAVQFYFRQGFEIVGFNDHLYTNHDVSDGEVALFLHWETTPEQHSLSLE
jgi:ribosomal protein S18 acetylase RimI-like enzyme